MPKDLEQLKEELSELKMDEGDILGHVLSHKEMKTLAKHVQSLLIDRAIETLKPIQQIRVIDKGAGIDTVDIWIADQLSELQKEKELL